MRYWQEKSHHGLNTLFIDDPHSGIASVQIWFRAGSALETSPNRGIAHFLEHMFFKGTPQRPKDTIASEVESFGGEINAFTSFDYTCYYINTPSTHLLNAVNILMDMVSNPEFKEEGLVPERDVVFEEYRGSIDNPNRYAFYQLQKSCFTKTYAHPILGKEKTIKNFNRDQLIEFRKNFYTKSNCMIVIAGELKHKDEATQALKNFDMPDGPLNQFPKFGLKRKASSTIHQRDVHHCQLDLAIESPNFKEDQAAAEDLAFNCLGHGESSRFYGELVAKGTLADHATASTSFMNRGGFHYIKIIFPYKSLKRTLQKTKGLLKTVISSGFSQAEIRKIKNQYIDSKVYDRESLESFAFSLGHSFAQTGDIESENQFIERIKSTPAGHVNHVLKDIFARPVHASLQIPLNKNLAPAKRALDSFCQDISTTGKKLKKIHRTQKQKIRCSKFDPLTQKIEISQGISLLYRKNPRTPTFVLHAYIRSGHSHESDRNSGSHKILSQVLTRGYKGVSRSALRESLEDCYAGLNGFSGRNAYGLSMYGQTRHFDELSKHFCGTLLSPTMEPHEVNHAQEILLRTLERNKHDPRKMCFKTVGEIMFAGHPYQKDGRGTSASIGRANSKNLLALHRKNLTKEDILITCCGDLELHQILCALESLTSLIKKTLQDQRSQKKRPCYPRTEERHLLFKREQSHIFTGIPTKGFGHRENILLKILTAHLSRQSSELFLQLREKQGLCYSTHPIHFLALEAGYWGLYVASGNDKAKTAMAILKKIIDRIRREGISEQHFATAKTIIAGKELMGLQTNEDYANAYSISTLHGYGLDFYHKELEAVKNFSYKDFQVQTSKIFSQKWSTVWVGQ